MCVLIFIGGIMCILPWPGTDSFHAAWDIPDEFGASGATWIQPQKLLAIAGDGGGIAVIDEEGMLVAFISYTEEQLSKSKFEGITIGPEVSNNRQLTTVYVAVEDSGNILEIDIPSGNIKRKFALSLLESETNTGTTGLTFIPESESTGYFYVANQLNGMIYVYYFDYYNIADGDTLRLHSLFTPIVSMTDLSGLCWDAENSYLWCLYNDDSTVYTFKNQTALTSEPGWHQEWVQQHHYAVPGVHQQGISIGGTQGQYIFLAEDRSKHESQVVRYLMDIIYYPVGHDDEDYWREYWDYDDDDDDDDDDK